MLAIDLEHAPGLALVAAGDHFDRVVLLDPDLDRLGSADLAFFLAID